MIHIKIEKDRKLSTQEIYEIIDFSVQAAYDNGFMNSFIFERALYLFAAIRFYEDRKDELAPMIAENINKAWDMLIADGTIEEMIENYRLDLNNLAEIGLAWFEEYTNYACSARGLLNTLQDFTGDIVNQAVSALQKTADETGVQQVLEVADKWGMNNGLPKTEQETASDSLFE